MLHLAIGVSSEQIAQLGQSYNAAHRLDAGHDSGGMSRSVIQRRVMY